MWLEETARQKDLHFSKVTKMCLRPPQVFSAIRFTIRLFQMHYAPVFTWIISVWI